MLRGVQIWLFYAVLCISVVLPQDREVNFNLAYPRFIPSGSAFDLSFTVTNTFPEANYFKLVIIPEGRISVNKVEYRSAGQTLTLPVSTIPYEEYNAAAYKVLIELDNSSVFQLLMNFKPEQLRYGSVKFDGAFLKDDEVIAYLGDGERDNFLTANIDFYKPQKTAEKAAQFIGQSKFEFDIVKNFSNSLLLDFWIRINDPEINFLKIMHKDFVQPVFEMSTNRFQMLSVSSTMQNQVFLRSFFAGRKSWHHISVYFSKPEGQAYFYCNGSLIAKYNLPGNLKTQDWKLVFENRSENKFFLLDLLRIIDYNNQIDFSFTNRHSIYFNSENSQLIALYKFDSSNEFLTNNKNVKLEFGGIKLVKSDAPVFAQSPELNIRLHSSMYELEWTGGDFRRAVSYTLEKSLNDGQFIQVYTVQADNKEDKIYSYLDAIDESSDIIYYRVKQNNSDGSSVYSSQVKVGQGLLEPFTLGQNFPNPFNPTTSIEVEMIEDAEVEITIYSLEGREIAKVFKGALNKGVHKFSFDGTELPSGIYLYQVSTPAFSQTRKMILTK
jgi:hypothetical protein